jgi:hypothetical protein
MRQTCKACGRPDKFDFTVPDEVWSAAVPEALQNRVVCLFCFDELARQRNVDYAASLSALHFAGDAAAIEFQSISFAGLAATYSRSEQPLSGTRCRVRPRSA